MTEQDRARLTALRLRLAEQRRYAELLRMHLADVRADLRVLRGNLTANHAELYVRQIETCVQDSDERFVLPLLADERDDEVDEGVPAA